MSVRPPEFPVGAFEQQLLEASPEQLQPYIDQIAHLPDELRDAIHELTDEQLQSVYRNWNIRQIVHHIADSHLHSYVRFRWTLTETEPTIKAYDEGKWSKLEESLTSDCHSSILLLQGLHQRWGAMLRRMTVEDFGRKFLHPETKDWVVLADALQYYAWHGRHHVGQIRWLRENRLNLES